MRILLMLMGLLAGSSALTQAQPVSRAAEPDRLEALAQALRAEPNITAVRLRQLLDSLGVASRMRPEMENERIVVREEVRAGVRPERNVRVIERRVPTGYQGPARDSVVVERRVMRSGTPDAEDVRIEVLRDRVIRHMDSTGYERVYEVPTVERNPLSDSVLQRARVVRSGDRRVIIQGADQPRIVEEEEEWVRMPYGPGQRRMNRPYYGPDGVLVVPDGQGGYWIYVPPRP